MQCKTMAAMQIFALAVGQMAVTNEQSEVEL